MQIISIRIEQEEEQAFIANAKGRNGQESPYTQVFENRDIRNMNRDIRDIIDGLWNASQV